jgi:hypothetical protein
MIEYRLFIYPKSYQRRWNKIPSSIFFDLGIHTPLEKTHQSTYIKCKQAYVENTIPISLSNEEDIVEKIYKEKIIWSDLTNWDFRKSKSLPTWFGDRCRSFSLELRRKRNKIKIKERNWEMELDVCKPTEKEKLEELQTFLDTKTGNHPYEISLLEFQDNSSSLKETVYYHGKQLPENAIEGKKILILKIEINVKKGYIFEWIKWCKEISLIQLYADMFQRHWFDVDNLNSNIIFAKTRSFLAPLLAYLGNYREFFIYFLIWVILTVNWNKLETVSLLEQLKIVFGYAFDEVSELVAQGCLLIMLIYISIWCGIWFEELTTMFIGAPFLFPVLLVLLCLRFLEWSEID